MKRKDKAQHIKQQSEPLGFSVSLDITPVNASAIAAATGVSVEPGSWLPVSVPAHGKLVVADNAEDTKTLGLSTQLGTSRFGTRIMEVKPFVVFNSLANHPIVAKPARIQILQAFLKQFGLTEEHTIVSKPTEPQFRGLQQLQLRPEVQKQLREIIKADLAQKPGAGPN